MQSFTEQMIEAAEAAPQIETEQSQSGDLSALLSKAVADLEVMLRVQELTPAYQVVTRQENKQWIEHFLIEVLELERAGGIRATHADNAWLGANFSLAG